MTMLIAATAALALTWTQQITANGTGSTEQSARSSTQALCQGMVAGVRNRCQADGGHFDGASESACFRFAAVCNHAGSVWNCNYFTNVTCVL